MLVTLKFVAIESLTDTDVDSQDDILSEHYEPLEVQKANNRINEQQYESDSHHEYEEHGIFPYASHLREEDKEYDEDESHDLDIVQEVVNEEKNKY